MSDKKKDLIAGGKASLKTLISRIPGFAEIFSGIDAYIDTQNQRNSKRLVESLEIRISAIESFEINEWVDSEEGIIFTAKVLSSALDSQLLDKQQLFINALTNGITSTEIGYYEKLKFVDMLRSLSYSSLMVLADIHNLCKGLVRSPDSTVPDSTTYPQVDPEKLSEQLSDKYHPYLINSAILEMQSQGLFSNIGEWRKNNNGTYSPGGGFRRDYIYTDFSLRFVEFIT